MLLLPSGGDLTANVFILGSTVTLTDTKEMVLDVKTWSVTCIQTLTDIHLGYTNIFKFLCLVVFVCLLVFVAVNFLVLVGWFFEAGFL